MSVGVLDWSGLTIGSGRYKILRKLGEGGMALIDLAVDAKLGSQVFVKAAKPELLKTGAFAARFTRAMRWVVIYETT